MNRKSKASQSYRLRGQLAGPLPGMYTHTYPQFKHQVGQAHIIPDVQLVRP